MRGLGYHERPRKAGAQIVRMAHKWPAFTCDQTDTTYLYWKGPLRGFQKKYTVGVLWNARSKSMPYVYLYDPKLKPRPGENFDSVPHLFYNEDKPERSGLCLFDPDGKEWSNQMLIADTTIPWAARWLFYYEMWLLDGVWRGGGVGPESIAAARAGAISGAQGKFADPSAGPSHLAD